MRIKQQFILASLLAASLPWAYAAPDSNLTNKIDQAKVLLNQIQNEVSQNNQTHVYLGTAQAEARSPSDLLESYTNQLIALLNTLQTNQAQPAVPGLQWQSVASTTNLSKENLFNAGKANENVNICRAAFIGVNAQSKAMYPGQLTANGCRISYAGYAFTVTKFDVLAGNDNRLQWISIADVKKSMNVTPKPNANTICVGGISPKSNVATKCVAAPMNDHYSSPFLGWHTQPTFNFNIKINGALAIAGGYEGGNPVLICRTIQNNTNFIGKLVFFGAFNGQSQDACDIGIDDKEVVIENNYELLFWKQSNQ
ncbi:MAG: hypothetical protein JO149_02840 [Gammaproteobacteria bacterium]|nr:hypothetical protein [Gammaproteobacteria bacterium]